MFELTNYLAKRDRCFRSARIRLLPLSARLFSERRRNILFTIKTVKRRPFSENEFLDIKAQSEGYVLSLDSLKEKLKSFVKHQEDLSEIDFVEIRYPLPLCRNNVEVVDTPGTNDLNTGRVDIIYNYLQKADAAILVTLYRVSSSTSI